MGLTHAFVSAAADPANPALIGKTKWNQDHVFNPAISGLIADPAGNNTFVGVSASSAGQVLERRRNVTSVTYGFADQPIFWAIKYNWSQTVAQTLLNSGGSSVTLAYLPDGLSNAASTNKHYIAIVNSTDSLTESCLITGISGTTINFQTVNNHTSGTWTIGSASGGVQEAIAAAEASASQGACVITPWGNINTYGTIRLFGGSGIHVRGHGTRCTNFVCHRYAMTTKDVFYCENSTQLIQLSDFVIGGHAYMTAGCGIHLKSNTAGRPRIDNVEIVDTFNGMWFENCSYLVLNNASYDQLNNQNSTALAPACGVKITGSTTAANMSFNGLQVYSPHSNAVSAPTDTWHLQFGVYIENADGITFTAPHIRAKNGFWVQAGTSAFIGTVLVNHGVIDSCRDIAVTVTQIGVPTVYGNIQFNNCHIIRNYTANPLVYCSLANSTSPVAFNGCTIGASQEDGIYGLNANNLTVDNCTIIDNNAGDYSNKAAINLEGTCNNVNVTNNKLYDTRGGSALQRYGIRLANTISRLTCTENKVWGNVSGGMSLVSTTITNSIIKNNSGISDVLTGVASATSIALPANGSRTITITGATAIATITGNFGPEDTVIAYPVTGTVFNTSGNIAKAYTTSGDERLTITWNPTAAKWYIQG